MSGSRTSAALEEDHLDEEHTIPATLPSTWTPTSDEKSAGSTCRGRGRPPSTQADGQEITAAARRLTLPKTATFSSTPLPKSPQAAPPRRSRRHNASPPPNQRDFELSFGRWGKGEWMGPQLRLQGGRRRPRASPPPGRTSRPRVSPGPEPPTHIHEAPAGANGGRRSQGRQLLPRKTNGNRRSTPQMPPAAASPPEESRTPARGTHHDACRRTSGEGEPAPSPLADQTHRAHPAFLSLPTKGGRRCMENL